MDSPYAPPSTILEEPGAELVQSKWAWFFGAIFSLPFAAIGTYGLYEEVSSFTTKPKDDVLLGIALGCAFITSTLLLNVFALHANRFMFQKTPRILLSVLACSGLGAFPYALTAFVLKQGQDSLLMGALICGVFLVIIACVFFPYLLALGYLVKWRLKKAATAA